MLTVGGAEIWTAAAGAKPLPDYCAPFGLAEGGTPDHRLRLVIRLARTSRAETAPASGLALRATFGRLDPRRPVGLIISDTARGRLAALRIFCAPARPGVTKRVGSSRKNTRARGGTFGPTRARLNFAFGCAPFGLALAARTRRQFRDYQRPYGPPIVS